MIDWNNMSNSEIKNKQKELSQEYEIIKDKTIKDYDSLNNLIENLSNKITESVNKLDKLDKEFNKSNEILKNRNKK